MLILNHQAEEISIMVTEDGADLIMEVVVVLAAEVVVSFLIPISLHQISLLLIRPLVSTRARFTAKFVKSMGLTLWTATII